MAAADPIQSLKNEAVCAVCLEFFHDPVTLDCGHNYCRSCIRRFWDKRDGEPCCPQCRQTFPRHDLRANRQLANIVQGLKRLKAGPGRGAASNKCALHRQELKLFCKDNMRPLCRLCALSRQRGILSVEEAWNTYQKVLEKTLRTLRREKKKQEEYELKENWKLKELEEEAEALDLHVGREFGKLHDFLLQEEKRVKTKLEEERRRNAAKLEANLTAIRRGRETLEEIIEDIETSLKQEATELLKGLKELLERSKVSLLPPAKVQVSLPLGEFRGPLQYRAWKEMIHVVDPAPTSLTLDPDTAHPFLALSKDLSSVKHGTQKQDVPELPARFDCSPCVLALEGFARGRHYWEVEVGEKTEWDVGVTRRSARRKGNVRPSPEDGYWALLLRGGDRYWASTTLWTPLALKVKPRKIGVYLDYKRGQLSFYNADDLTHIYTFTDTFAEKLYPYFCLCVCDGGKNAEPLRICKKGVLLFYVNSTLL
ncbi:E3 ubiquitin-protein ligase TRIM39-like [Latimeria chalumnae]|uniref:E3 ubiquitin-protein ligase TRIM39-like n=1 Tax=Latimeria chalumnae TaxID=7897 RepID=UPI0003C126ED|nr:PREDICTED: E3 ubiquitin-protein ligase TRIM39-like [Latimeria chalumnae]|eukprot:XP_006001013.1 PREDICTED: E3 ubiquitin-protein ligase TRIM39-like [Latimeria chalumnae]